MSKTNEQESSGGIVTIEGVMPKEEVREKILHTLDIYPVISPTMLQGGLGAYLKPQVWRPVLTELIQEGVVCETTESRQTPSGRYNTYTKLYRAENAHMVMDKDDD